MTLAFSSENYECDGACAGMHYIGAFQNFNWGGLQKLVSINGQRYQALGVNPGPLSAADADSLKCTNTVFTRARIAYTCTSNYAGRRTLEMRRVSPTEYEGTGMVEGPYGSGVHHILYKIVQFYDPSFR